MKKSDDHRYYYLSMPATPEEILANNRRKIEKDKRRLAYHDLQVQGTNNSSIMSKRSVETIYNPILEPELSEWIKFFVPKAKRRSPAINRGYWIRVESIKQMIFRIRDQYSDQPVRIVNLGCGFDVLPFQLLEQGGNYEFYDFDYPELVQRKLAVMNEAPEILLVVGDKNEITPVQKNMGIVMATPKYKLVGCDLKNTELYKKQLESLLPKGAGPTIFIAEVSLAYMKPEDANPVIEISAQVEDSHFLVLEQIMPSGPQHFFAKKMLYHFSHLRSPLQCVETYSTKEKQTERFRQYFPDVEIRDLFECWNELVSRDKKKAVDEVEAFDEWEEFIVFCQHYVVIHATNSTKLAFRKHHEKDDITGFNEDVTLQHQELDLELKFPAASETDGGCIVYGGMWQSRTNETLQIDNDGNKSVLQISEGPSPRMCHTLTNAQNGTLVLTGGRGRPGLAFDDIWTFHIESKKWTKTGTLHSAMYRHSAICTEPGKVLVFGEGQFVEITNSEITTLRILGDIPKLASCALTFDPEQLIGYIVGGMSSVVEPLINSEVYRYKVTNDAVIVEPVLLLPQLARIGCHAFLEKNLLVVVGGAGLVLQDQNTTVLVVNTLTWSLQKVQIPQSVWQTNPVFLGSASFANHLIGGGAVCYSFGSAYSGAYLVEVA